MAQLAFVRVESLPGTTTYDLAPSATGSVVFAGLTPGARYSFAIRAYGRNGLASLAAYTAPVTITRPATPTTRRPTAPTLPPIVTPGPPTPPGVPRPCVATRWPSWATGRPTRFATGAPQGAYLWFDGSAWSLRVFNPGGPVVFTGSIQANTRVSFTASGIERGDLLSRGSTSARFSFRSANDIDGIRISASCATLLRIQVSINGVPLHPHQIYLGPSSVASQNPVSIVR